MAAAAAVLASHTCCDSIWESKSNGIPRDDRSLWGLSTNYNRVVKTRRLGRFRVKMQKRELPPPQLGKYGKFIKMVPTSEIRKQMSHVLDKPENVNGSPKKVNGVHVATSRSLVKKDLTLPPSKLSRLNEFPPIEGPRPLPSDETFSWANENYNSVQITIDVWSSLLSLRIRVLLDNAKWTYIGGFSEEKQVNLCSNLVCLSTKTSWMVYLLYINFQKHRRRKTASWLRERILHLGPTLIKLGQLLSTRSDLFPKEYVEELSKLQVTILLRVV